MTPSVALTKLAVFLIVIVQVGTLDWLAPPRSPLQREHGTGLGHHVPEAREPREPRRHEHPGPWSPEIEEGTVLMFPLIWIVSVHTRDFLHRYTLTDIVWANAAKTVNP